jgi:hypothetical protein
VIHVRARGPGANNGATIATLVELGCHPEVVPEDNTLVSADFPGYCVRALEREFGGVGIYVSGDLGALVSPVRHRKPENPDWCWDEARRIGERLAGYASEAVKTIREYESAPRLAAYRSPIFLDNSNFYFHVMEFTGILDRPIYGSGYIESEVNLWEIGKLRIASLPGELSPDLGMRIRKICGHPAMILGLANDELGYLFPSYDFDLALYDYERTLSVGKVRRGPAPALDRGPRELCELLPADPRSLDPRSARSPASPPSAARRSPTRRKGRPGPRSRPRRRASTAPARLVVENQLASDDDQEKDFWLSILQRLGDYRDELARKAPPARSRRGRRSGSRGSRRDRARRRGPTPRRGRRPLRAAELELVPLRGGDDAAVPHDHDPPFAGAPHLEHEVGGEPDVVPDRSLALPSRSAVNEKPVGSASIVNPTVGAPRAQGVEQILLVPVGRDEQVGVLDPEHEIVGIEVDAEDLQVRVRVDLGDGGDPPRFQELVPLPELPGRRTDHLLEQELARERSPEAERVDEQRREPEDRDPLRVRVEVVDPDRVVARDREGIRRLDVRDAADAALGDDLVDDLLRGLLPVADARGRPEREDGAAFDVDLLPADEEDAPREAARALVEGPAVRVVRQEDGVDAVLPRGARDVLDPAARVVRELRMDVDRAPERDPVRVAPEAASASGARTRCRTGRCAACAERCTRTTTPKSAAAGERTQQKSPRRAHRSALVASEVDDPAGDPGQEEGARVVLRRQRDALRPPEALPEERGVPRGHRAVERRPHEEDLRRIDRQGEARGLDAEAFAEGPPGAPRGAVEIREPFAAPAPRADLVAVDQDVGEIGPGDADRRPADPRIDGRHDDREHAAEGETDASGAFGSMPSLESAQPRNARS